MQTLGEGPRSRRDCTTPEAALVSAPRPEPSCPHPLTPPNPDCPDVPSYTSCYVGPRGYCCFHSKSRGTTSWDPGRAAHHCSHRCGTLAPWRPPLVGPEDDRNSSTTYRPWSSPQSACLPSGVSESGLQTKRLARGILGSRENASLFPQAPLPCGTDSFVHALFQAINTYAAPAAMPGSKPLGVGKKP